MADSKAQTAIDLESYKDDTLLMKQELDVAVLTNREGLDKVRLR